MVAASAMLVFTYGCMQLSGSCYAGLQTGYEMIICRCNAHTKILHVPTHPHTLLTSKSNIILNISQRKYSLLLLFLQLNAFLWAHVFKRGIWMRYIVFWCSRYRERVRIQPISRMNNHELQRFNSPQPNSPPDYNASTADTTAYVYIICMLKLTLVSLIAIYCLS